MRDLSVSTRHGLIRFLRFQKGVYSQEQFLLFQSALQRAIELRRIDRLIR